MSQSYQYSHQLPPQMQQIQQQQSQVDCYFDANDQYKIVTLLQQEQPSQIRQISK